MKLSLNLLTNIVAFLGVLVQTYVQYSSGTLDIGTAINTVLVAIGLYFTGK